MNACKNESQGEKKKIKLLRNVEQIMKLKEEEKKKMAMMMGDG